MAEKQPSLAVSVDVPVRSTDFPSGASASSTTSPLPTPLHSRQHSRTRSQRGTSFLTVTSALGFKQRKAYFVPPTYSTDIQDYTVLELTGVVDDVSHLYLARYEPTQELVSLKLTDLTLAMNYEFLAEMMDTAQNTRLCQHENILGQYGSFVEQERLWTVVDLVRSGTCKQLLQNHFPTGIANEIVIASILREVLKGLCYLHGNHYIHNNIRADTILLDTTGEVRLAGMHQLKPMMHAGRLQRSVFKFVGEPEWMAPEVLSQATTCNSKIDIYSLGITALELFHGKTPFEDWPALKILLCKLQYELPNEVTGERRALSKQFAKFIDRCLIKNPMQRPSAEQLLEDPFIRQARGSHYIVSHLLGKASPATSATTPTTGSSLDSPSSPNTGLHT